MNDHQTPYSVIVIDDHPLFRRGAVQLFELDNSFKLIGDAEGGEDGIELIRQLDPDLVLLDLNMKGMDGIAVLKNFLTQTLTLNLWFAGKRKND